MKVLHVITGLQTGGAERMLANLAIASLAAGYVRPPSLEDERATIGAPAAGYVRPPSSEDRRATTGAPVAGRVPVVVALCPGGSQYDRLCAAGVRTITLGMTRGVPSLTGLIRLARLIRDESPDVVQSWMYHADLYALLALWLSGRRRTRLYWGIRCSDMDFRHYSIWLRITVRVCALLSRFVDGIVVNSRAGARVHRRLGYDARRMTVIDNGFDIATFRPDAAARASMRRALGLAPDAFVVGCVARLDEMKDFPTLSAALDRLDGVTCIAVGKDTEALGNIKGLIPLGERTDVPSLLNAFDLLVCASVSEGFSNAIGEAMATGVPVVATDVGDSARILGDTGRVVPPRDPVALADAIASLKADTAMRLAMGRAASRRIEQHFSLQRSLEAFETLYGPPGAESASQMPGGALPQRSAE